MVVLSSAEARTAARALRVAADYYLAQSLAMSGRGYPRSAQVMDKAAGEALWLAAQLELLGNRKQT